jgi:hypothetical protein
MAVQVKVRVEKTIDVYNFAQAAGWIEKDSGSLSVVNARHGEMALFRRWDSVMITDDDAKG